MKVRFQPLGDEALLINFDQKIDEAINKQVHTLAGVIEEKKLKGLKYVTPAYCSLVLAFDKNQLSYDELVQQTGSLLKRKKLPKLSSRKLYIPVCYDRKFALDMDEVIRQTNLSASEIVKKHTSQIFKTYMMGFLPGFPYLGKLPSELECVRKATPRLEVLQGAVGLAGLQTGIYPKASPGGWQIIGRTPVKLVCLNADQPYLFEAGDQVSFYSISKKKYQTISKDQKNGHFNWANVYE
jgi:KipI family sensor histidine kinase inhibitor